MKIVIFDLDGTLAESKSPIGSSMGDALKLLLQRYDVAIISGGAWEQFERQVLDQLQLDDQEKRRLYLLPTSGTTFYRFVDGAWTCVYSDKLTVDEASKIKDAFRKLINDSSLELPKKTWGEILENRGTQFTFSAMGQQAPVEEKKNWDPNFSKRLKMIEFLRPLLPEFEIRTGGSTSIDVTRRGIDKSYGIFRLEEIVGIKKQEMVFVGDALFPGGNDRAVYEVGVECIETWGPEETLNMIASFLNDC